MNWPVVFGHNCSLHDTRTCLQLIAWLLYFRHQTTNSFYFIYKIYKYIFKLNFYWDCWIPDHSFPLKIIYSFTRQYWNQCGLELWGSAKPSNLNRIPYPKRNHQCPFLCFWPHPTQRPKHPLCPQPCHKILPQIP
jgi:hypothetical protein